MNRRIDTVLDTLDLDADGQVDRKRIVLQPGHWSSFDPFLMMAEDWFTQPGFTWHPHRGIETVTFVLSGRQRHGDTTGVSSILEPGDAQWMTAGRGIIHQELAEGDDTVHSLQLWINLPAAHKMMDPRLQNLRRAEQPTQRNGDATITVYAGPGSNTQTVQPMAFVDVALRAKGTALLHTPEEWRAIVYVLEGEVNIGDTKVAASQVALSHPGSGDQLVLESNTATRLLMFSGLPINETVVQHGPFVMNTHDQIDQAIADYHSGRLAPAPNRSKDRS